MPGSWSHATAEVATGGVVEKKPSVSSTSVGDPSGAACECSAATASGTRMTPLSNRVTPAHVAGSAVSSRRASSSSVTQGTAKRTDRAIFAFDDVDFDMVPSRSARLPSAHGDRGTR